MFDRALSNDYVDAIGEMRVMRDRVREIRTRYCKPESNANPRYLARGATDIAAKFQDYVENPPKHENDEHPEDRYRVWPLPQDRKAFEWRG